MYDKLLTKYHNLVNSNNNEQLNKFLTHVSHKTLRQYPDPNYKKFYEYLWSFNRSIVQHPHSKTNIILGREFNSYTSKLQQNYYNSLSTYKSLQTRLKRLKTR
jgi:hypothetical protein